MKIDVIETEDKIVLNIYRETLESLVEKAALMRKNMKRFYDADVDAVKLLEMNNDFLLFGLKRFKKDDSYIVFVGKKYEGKIYEEGERTLGGKDVELIIYGINNHKTCARFAYGAYQLIKMNLDRFFILRRQPQLASDLLVEFINSNKTYIEDYFNQRLSEYLK